MSPIALDTNGSSKDTIKNLQHYSLTPGLGEIFYENFQLSVILSDDTALQKLGTLIAERGVIFFKNQSSLSAQHLPTLVQKLGEMTGKPADSGLHTHPLSLKDFDEDGTKRKHAGELISTESDKRGLSIADDKLDINRSQFASDRWHSDISFEPRPADFSILKLTVIPSLNGQPHLSNGGDTLWASGYEAYQRLSLPFRKLLEGCHAVHSGHQFIEQAARHGATLEISERGAPENKGGELKAVHPVIRTHPVIIPLPVGKFYTLIPQFNKDESDLILRYLFRLFADNHNLQVRYTWGINDTAIWDNRAVLHTATFDFVNQKRVGQRCVGVGEIPYFDPTRSTRSKSRDEALTGRIE